MADTLEFLLETYAYVYEVDTGWGIEGATLTRLYNEILDIQEVFEKIEEYDGSIDTEDLEKDTAQHLFRTKVSDKVLLFFTLSTEVIKPLSIDLIMEEVIHERHQSAGSRKFVESLGQPNREELMFRSGLIDGDLKGKMANVRRVRNSLTHNLRERHLLESVDNIVSELENSLAVINSLHEQVEGYPLTFEEE